MQLLLEIINVADLLIGLAYLFLMGLIIFGLIEWDNIPFIAVWLSLADMLIDGMQRQLASFIIASLLALFWIWRCHNIRKQRAKQS